MEYVLTLGSMFLVALPNTSRVFFVQCGRHGNSLISAVANLGSTHHQPRQHAIFLKDPSSYRMHHYKASHPRCWA